MSFLGGLALGILIGGAAVCLAAYLWIASEFDGFMR